VTACVVVSASAPRVAQHHWPLRRGIGDTLPFARRVGTAKLVIRGGVATAIPRHHRFDSAPANGVTLKWT